MLTIGNIVTKEDINIDNYFNIVDNIININKDLPTLIIGWEDYVKNNFEDVDFVDRVLNKNMFWTFSKRERRDKMNIDLYNFEEYCVNLFLKKIDYIYLNPMTISNNKLKNFYNFIKENESLYYDNETMIYIYSDDKIFGLNKIVFNYMKYDVNKIIKSFKKKCTYIVDEKNNYTILDNINNKEKYIPYLNYVEKKEACIINE